MDRLSYQRQAPRSVPAGVEGERAARGRDEHDDEGAASISESASRANLEGLSSDI